ncbi:LANO_0F07954g1_1 [Lachancea nothofagi CBS 11611]|uniref:Glycerophosphocholine acyltransferase 1 n=1 Tax=Lachancea nothofagi CBS 11611 TaxID=1266666 RepID=A0A1G4K9A5_9SACH|nr:LANO_0F07954g1_1 [Lachancea nothofagi CBS 11611]
MSITDAYETDSDEGKSPSWIPLASWVELLDPVSSTAQSYHLPKRYFSSATKKIKNTRPRQKLAQLRTTAQDLTPQLEEFKRRTLGRLQALDKPLETLFFHQSSHLEKWFYPFTLVNIFAIGFIIGKYPEWFHVYYTAMLILLMPVRYYTYYKTNSHYYMADLCYYVNMMCLLFIWVWPQSVHLYQSCFAFTFGTLCFAVITWRNSLVIHSVDKITSCFIHIMPPLTMYTIRHGISEDLKLARFPAASLIASKKWNLKHNIFWTSIYYLVWQSAYHYFITLRQSSKIKSGQRVTSFEYLTSHQFKNFWAVRLPEPWPMIFYILIQYCYQLGTMMLCGIWFHYRRAAGAFLLFIYICAAKNGATYYIDHYGKKFEKDVAKLKMEVEELQQQLEQKTLIEKSSASDVESSSL